MKINVLENLESMLGILDIGWQVLNQGCHNTIEKTGDEFGGTTTSRDNRSTWVVRFVNFGQEVHDRCARCDVYEVFGSLREITSFDKVMNGLSDGGLMNGSQILVNPPVKSGVTQLSVGFITV